MTAGGGRFIAVGGQGKASISGDYGATWTLYTDTSTGFGYGDTITASHGMSDGKVILAASGGIRVMTPTP